MLFIYFFLTYENPACDKGVFFSPTHGQVLDDLANGHRKSFSGGFLSVFKFRIPSNEFLYDVSKPSLLCPFLAPGPVLLILLMWFLPSPSASQACVGTAVATLEFFEVNLELQTSKSHLRLWSLALESTFSARHTFTLRGR